MASSPTDSAAQRGTLTPVGFALQELIACWDQSYEALARGDLVQVEALLGVAQEHMAAAGNGSADSSDEARLRSDAATANGRLQHGLRVGMTSVQDELGRTRQGSKALRGYGTAAPGISSSLQKSV